MKLFRLLFAPRTLGKGMQRVVRRTAANSSVQDGSTKTEITGIYSKKYLGRGVVAEMTTDFYGNTRFMISSENGNNILGSVIERGNQIWKKVSCNIFNFNKRTRIQADGMLYDYKESFEPETIEAEMREIKKYI